MCTLLKLEDQFPININACTEIELEMCNCTSPHEKANHKQLYSFEVQTCDRSLLSCGLALSMSVLPHIHLVPTSSQQTHFLGVVGQGVDGPSGGVVQLVDYFGLKLTLVFSCYIFIC